MSNHPYLSPQARQAETTYPSVGFGDVFNGNAAASPGTTVELEGDLGLDLAAKKPSKYKLWLLNKGADPMFVYQNDKPVMVVIGGAAMFEFIDPYNGDLAVIGSVEAFTMFVTGQVANIPT